MAKNKTTNRDSYKELLLGELRKEITQSGYMVNCIPKFIFPFPDINPINRY